MVSTADHTAGHVPGAEPTSQEPPPVTAQAIPKPITPPSTTAMPAHAAPATTTSATSPTATATPIQTTPSPGIDATPAPTPAPEVHLPPPPETPPESLDQRVASLSAIFPDFDSGLLDSVLESVDWNEERAADVLLGMSDPNYVSQVPPAERQTRMTQTELDEQLAHRLMLEDQQRDASWRASNRDRQATNRGAPNPPPGQPGQSGDAMDKFFDSVDKFAETSKKTLTNLFQKVKSEFEGTRGGNANQGNRLPQEEAWQGQSQTYYAPPAQPRSAPTPTVPQGYDIQSSSPPPPRPSEPELRAPPQRATLTTPPPNNSIDPSKIGMLPKRPVSLLGPQTPTAPSPTSPKRDSGDGDLDYVENPFEEGRHR